MKRVLFIMLPTKSHYIPCIEMAKDLVQRGYQVFFSGTVSLQEFIEYKGFNFVRFKYMPTYQVNSLKSFFGVLIKSLLDQSFKTQRYHEFLENIISAQQVCLDLNPNLIFIDEHLSHYFFYLAGHSSNLYLLNTKQSTRKVAGIPPLNSSYVARNNKLSFLISELLWQKHLFFKRIRAVLNEIAFVGKGNEHFQHSYIKASKLPVIVTDETSMYDYDSIIGVKTIILVSEKLDYPWRKKLPDELFLNYQNTSTNESLPDYLHWIIDAKATSSSLVYCAVGTLADNEPDSYIEFFTRLIHAFEKRPNYQLLISTGSTFILEQLMSKSIPNHVQLYDRLPQTSILPHCNMMITHGGLNSVKEAIAAAVPMLGIINPAHKHTDTSGNIARLKYHQIGLACKISSTEPDILILIDELLTNPLYKKKITDFREHLASSMSFIE